MTSGRPAEMFPSSLYESFTPLVVDVAVRIDGVGFALGEGKRAWILIVVFHIALLIALAAATLRSVTKSNAKIRQKNGTVVDSVPLMIEAVGYC